MEGTIAPEQIIINGQEYAPEDASSLIELGNKYREMEKNLNTSLDKVVPEYTRATQRAARAEQLEQELAERNKQLEQYQAKEKQTAIPQERQDIIKAARDAGLADQEWLKEQEYIRKTDLDSYFEEKYSQKQSQQQLIDNVLKTAGSLEKEIDGSDGRAPFNQKAVLAYASAYQINDLKQAYEEMNEGANARWKEAQIAKESRPGLTTLKPGGKKVPTERAISTDDDFKNAWAELYGTE